MSIFKSPNIILYLAVFKLELHKLATIDIKLIDITFIYLLHSYKKKKTVTEVCDTLIPAEIQVC